MKALFNLLGILCYLFAIVDFAGMIFGYDLTGVSWSPIVAGVIGGIFTGIASKNDDEGNEESN